MTVRKLALRWILQAGTAPLPKILPPGDLPALMTKDEFLKLRNPGETSHDTGTFDWSVSQMNRDVRFRVVDRRQRREGEWVIESGQGGYLLNLDGKLVAVAHKGILYHSDRNTVRILPEGYHDEHNVNQYVDMGIKRRKLVKYLDEYSALVSEQAKINRNKHPHIYRRIKLAGESFVIRFEQAPEFGKMTNMAIINEAGQIVAVGQNEWGATLLVVAQEYRGRGLGKILGQIWYKWNPRSQSGGFTSQGKANAIRIWESRVREVLSRGWYSDLIAEGRLTRERVKEILAGLGRRPPSPSRLPGPVRTRPRKRESSVLFFVDGGLFIIYDEAFYAEPDDKHIYGFGFLRDSSVGTFFYRLEYDRAYRKLATYTGLQMARDLGTVVYNGKGYGDLLEIEGLGDLKQEGDFLSLEKDVLPLRSLSQKEKLVRRKRDQFDEKKMLLMEMAHSKWD